MFCHCSLFTSPLSYHFPPFLLLTPRPERPKKNTAGCGHGKNALWDAKRAWRPTYSLAIRSSNWLGKVWQTTKKGIYIYIYMIEKEQISRIRCHCWDGWHVATSCLFPCFVVLSRCWSENLRFGIVDQRFSQCVLTIWNGKDETWKPPPWAEVTTLRWWNVSKS